MINVVLYEPEIPENTGNIMRTCAGTNSYLHLIEPLGFVMDEKRIKRSGVNYIDKVHYQRYIDFDDFKNKNEGEYYYFTRYGTKAYSEIDFSDKNKNTIAAMRSILGTSLSITVKNTKTAHNVYKSPQNITAIFRLFSILTTWNTNPSGPHGQTISLP